MKKLIKKQTGGVLGFGTVGKQKNTLTQKEVAEMQKKAETFQKQSTAKRKKFESDLKSGKIVKAGMSKNKK
jgi:transcription antitermination factor NusG